MPRCSSFTCIASLVLSGLTAQSVPDNPTLPSHHRGLRSPIHTAPDDPVGGAYGTWAATDAYKVGFHRHMTIVPYLGRNHPQNEPLSWKTVSVQIGDCQLLGQRESPTRAHSSHRYEYRFTRFVEAYDVLPAGVEQTFVLPVRPRAHGDLIVVGEVSTGLHCRATKSSHGALLFRDSGETARIRYGEAFAVDASGRKVPATTAYERGRVTLTVDGSWLAEAEFPVVLDPLLAPVTVSTDPAAVCGYMDLAVGYRVCSPSSVPVTLGVAVRWASATDADLRGLVFAPGFAGTVVFEDVTTSWSTEHARCTASQTSICDEHFVIALIRHFHLPATPHKKIRWQIRPVTDRTLNNAVDFYNPMSPLTDYSDWRIDVGGAGSVPPSAILTWQRDLHPGTGFGLDDRSTIMALVLDPSTGIYGTETQLSPFGPDVDCERPTVNSRRIGNDSWFVAWQMFDNSVGTAVDDWDVVGRAITGAGTPRAAVYVSNLANNHGGVKRHQLAPLVAGRQGRYLVSLTAVNQSTQPNKVQYDEGDEVWCERVDFDEVTAAFDVKTPRILRAVGPNPRNWRLGGLAYDSAVTRSHWAVSVHGIAADEAFAHRVGYRGVVTETGLMYSRPGEPVVVGGVAHNPIPHDRGEFVLAYGAQDAAGTNPFFHRMLTYPAGQSSYYGVGCGNATPEVAYASGQGPNFPGFPILVGSEGVGLVLRSAPGSWAIAVLGFDPASSPLSPFGLSGCWLLVDTMGPGYVGSEFVSVAGGEARVTINVPEFVVPGTVHLQWLYESPGPVPALTTRGFQFEIK